MEKVIGYRDGVKKKIDDFVDAQAAIYRFDGAAAVRAGVNPIKLANAIDDTIALAKIMEELRG